MIRAAIHSSPTTSPVKGQVARDVSLHWFRDLKAADSFDYGVGEVHKGIEIQYPITVQISTTSMVQRDC